MRGYVRFNKMNTHTHELFVVNDDRRFLIGRRQDEEHRVRMNEGMNACSTTARDCPVVWSCMYCHTYSKSMDQPGKVRLSILLVVS